MNSVHLLAQKMVRYISKQMKDSILVSRLGNLFTTSIDIQMHENSLNLECFQLMGIKGGL